MVDQDGQKAIAACVKYAQLADQNAQLGHGVGDAIAECMDIQWKADGSQVDHLKEAWAQRDGWSEEDGPVFPTDQEVPQSLRQEEVHVQSRALSNPS